MREEDKLYKAIKQDGIDTQSEILEELKRRYPQYVEQSNSQNVSVGKRKIAIISALATVAVCLAIVLPCVLLLPNHDDGDNIRYCAQGEYEKSSVQYTIGEYREQSGLKFLYFDWYEQGEDCSTSFYISNSGDEVLCWEESIYLIQSNEFVQLSITKDNVYLSAFDFNIKSCDEEHVVDNHTVKWAVIGDVALSIFEDNGYRYFIQIEEGQDENRLFELVAELLETK